ncbi:MAG TPA: tetratricopeptide repeat protein [Chthoniobacteraceae bacterium]|jgi:tetratricopeptide (TPR) repeat protein
MNDGISPHLRLGQQCRELRRLPEAERHFRDALAENPRDDAALHELALTLHLQDDRDREALEVAERAISVDPNDALHHALRAFILNGLDRPKEALAAARESRRLDPYCVNALVAEAQTHMLLRDWSDAERAARAALELDADFSPAANMLAQALRMQNKTAENDAQIAGLLARNPEDEVTHLNAGWSALQRGDHRTAEQHFREALRLDPELDPAREGLLTSFRARSPFYRAYLAYSLWMARHKAGMQWAIIIGVLVGTRLLKVVAQKFSPTLATAIGALYLLFVLWIFVADAVGNFILLSDRFARYALRPAEKREAIFVGGGIVLGLLLLGAGLLIPGGFVLALFGGVLLAASIPFSMVFTNPSRLGSALFAVAGAIPLVGLGVFLIQPALGTGLLSFGVLACLLSTWLASVPALRRK